MCSIIIIERSDFMLEIIGTIFIIVLGSLSHFFYDWFNHNKIVGYFTAVNESTWEHLKLVIAPTFIWLIIEYHFYYDNPNLFFARFISLMVMLIIIPLIFYSYTYFTKKSILFIDISSFIISIVIGQMVFNKLINLNISNMVLNHIGIIGLIAIFLVYITNTYVPGMNFLNKDPITKKYGLHGHYDGKVK